MRQYEPNFAAMRTVCKTAVLDGAHNFRYMRSFSLFQFVLFFAIFAAHRTGAVDYGADVSFPVHHRFDNNVSNPLGDRKAFYDNFMNGCRKHHGRKGNRCDEGERGRLAMSLRQPQSMVVSFTGFDACLLSALNAEPSRIIQQQGS